MTDTIAARIEENFKYSQIMWISSAVGIVLLFIVGWLIIFRANDSAGIQNQALFFIAIIIATGILIYKRNMLTAGKLSDIAEEENDDRTGAIIQKFRRSYIVVWMMAQTIAVIGIIDLVSSNNLRSFIIYSVVSLYALVINYPRKKLLTAAIQTQDNE